MTLTDEKYPKPVELGGFPLSQIFLSTAFEIVSSQISRGPDFRSLRDFGSLLHAPIF